MTVKVQSVHRALFLCLLVMKAHRGFASGIPNDDILMADSCSPFQLQDQVESPLLLLHDDTMATSLSSREVTMAMRMPRPVNDRRASQRGQRQTEFVISTLRNDGKLQNRGARYEIAKGNFDLDPQTISSSEAEEETLPTMKKISKRISSQFIRQKALYDVKHSEKPVAVMRVNERILYSGQISVHVPRENSSPSDVGGYGHTAMIIKRSRLVMSDVKFRAFFFNASTEYTPGQELSGDRADISVRKLQRSRYISCLANSAGNSQQLESMERKSFSAYFGVYRHTSDSSTSLVAVIAQDRRKEKFNHRSFVLRVAPHVDPQLITVLATALNEYRKDASRVGTGAAIVASVYAAAYFKSRVVPRAAEVMKQHKIQKEFRQQQAGFIPPPIYNHHYEEEYD